MQKLIPVPNRSGSMPAVWTFIIIVVVLMIIALLNAPTMGGPRVMASTSTYLAEVQKTGLPYLAAVGVAAVGLGFFAAREVKKVWSDRRKRSNLLTGYAFLAPYLLVTLTFVIGVLLSALYLSFTSYDIFTAPKWIGLQNYARAFRGLYDPIQKDFIQSLYNVFWYTIIVVSLQTTGAILLAVLLNAPVRFRQFFRTIFYGPSVTSSVVITLIFIWLYLRTGYVNFVFAKVLGVVGIQWQGINWLGDPRGLIELVVNAFGGTIASDQWFLKGPSIAWMAIMVQNIFTTIPTFMIMFLAALQDISPALYEAASIDGANGRQQFFRITLPMLRPIILLVVVLGTIGSLQVFDQVYLATQGGPLGTSQTPIYLTFTEALGKQGPIHMGYAMALAFTLAVIIFVITLVQRRFLERGTELY
ncbi:MAG: sugar ABC transporter permease [Anaerolineaceae bacterium]|nr:sugar ABC transporter permease [Anaerolineaceae bacterium]